MWKFISKISLIFVLILMFSGNHIVIGQNELPEKREEQKVGNEEINNPFLESDLQGAQKDSIRFAPDSLSNSNIETTVKYTATDSILTFFQDQRIALYNKAKVTYGEISLESYFIEIDYETSTIRARPFIDSLGQATGRPLFKDGGDQYQTDSMDYNFKTKKALIHGVLSKEGDGYLIAKRVKKNQYDELFAGGARFCPCEDPVSGTYFKTNKIKIVPQKLIVTGPSHLYIGNVPTPLWIPFGMFPSPKQKSSGIIVPAYGEDRLRGFKLEGGGYYFAFSDYVDLKLTGTAYTKGSWAANLASTYKKRYAFGGNVSINYNVRQLAEEENNSTSNDFRVTWSHSQTPKGNSNFSASVNFMTNSYNNNSRINASNPSQILGNTEAQVNSNINFTQKIAKGFFNLTASARHSQNLRTKQVQVTLPNLSLNMKRVNPFKKKGSSGGAWYEKISINYSMQTKNSYTNDKPTYSSSSFTPANDFIPVADRVEDDDEEEDLYEDIYPFDGENLPTILKNGKFGMKHNASLGTNIKLFKYFTLTPNLSYEEIWYDKALTYTYVGTTTEEEDDLVEVGNDRGFQRLYSYSGGMSLSTNVYGVKQIKSQTRRLRAIRHSVIPRASVSLSPDFSENKKVFREVQVGLDPTTDTALLNRFDKFIFGSPTSGEAASMSFGVNNIIEAKILQKNDTTGKAEKVKILDNLSFNGSYNFLADEHKLSNITMAARSSLFKNLVSISINGNFDPYGYIKTSENEDGTFTQERSLEIASLNQWQLTSGSVALSTSLNPKKIGKQEEKKKKEAKPDFGPAEQPGGNLPIKGNIDYLDWDIPWDLRISYSLRYSKLGFNDANITQSMTFSGNVSLAEKWKIGFSSGYDYEAGELTTTNTNLSRDLGCWVMAFNWVPFGRFTSYSFDIRIKAAMLKDLKYNKQSVRNL